MMKISINFSFARILASLSGVSLRHYCGSAGALFVKEHSCALDIFPFFFFKYRMDTSAIKGCEKL